MVYNVSGQLVDVIHEGHMDASMEPVTMTWDASTLASGMYVVKATTADVTVSQKVMLVK